MVCKLFGILFWSMFVYYLAFSLVVVWKLFGILFGQWSVCYLAFCLVNGLYVIWHFV